MSLYDYDILQDDGKKVWLVCGSITGQTLFYTFGYFGKNIKSQELILHYKQPDGKVILESLQVKLPATLMMMGTQQIVTYSSVEFIGKI